MVDQKSIIVLLKKQVKAVIYPFVLSKSSQKFKLWRLLSKISCLRKSGLCKRTSKLNKNRVPWTSCDLHITWGRWSRDSWKIACNTAIGHLVSKQCHLISSKKWFQKFWIIWLVHGKGLIRNLSGSFLFPKCKNLYTIKWYSMI